jgi:signal transduction histidine kinase
LFPQLRTPLNHVLTATDVLEKVLEDRYHASGADSPAAEHGNAETGHAQESSGADLAETGASAESTANGSGYLNSPSCVTPSLINGKDVDDVAQLLETMRSSACHLLDIINDILDLRYGSRVSADYIFRGCEPESQDDSNE